MARKKARKPRKPPSTPGPAWSARSRMPIDLRALRRLGVVAAWTALLGGAAAAWVYGIPQLVARAEAHSSFQTATRDGSAPAVAVEFHALPAWMRGEELDRLRLIVAEAVSGNALRRDELAVARESLLETGWFDSVAQVRRVARDRVEVVADFAEPRGLVRRDGRDHLVDAQGRLLPRSWTAGEGPELGVIVGVASERPRRFGETWPGADVTAALSVLAVVDEQPWAAQVHGVDVSEFAPGRLLRLLTDRGTVIRWGRAPGEERAAEVPAAMKLDYLTHHYRRYGHIDGGLEGEVDVSSDVAVVR